MIRRTPRVGHVEQDIVVADVTKVNRELLCATCRARMDRGAIVEVEDFCRRCWEIVAPLVIEESDAPLVPVIGLD